MTEPEARIITSDKKKPDIMDFLREVMGVTIPEDLINEDEEDD